MSQKAKGKRKARPEDDDADGDSPDEDDTSSGIAPKASQHPERKIYSQHKVRTSLKDRTLDSMIPIAHPSQRPSTDSANDGSGTPATPPVLKDREIKESDCILKSVVELRTDVLRGRHNRERSPPPTPEQPSDPASAPQSSARYSRNTRSSASSTHPDVSRSCSTARGFTSSTTARSPQSSFTSSACASSATFRASGSIRRRRSACSSRSRWTSRTAPRSAGSTETRSSTYAPSFHTFSGHAGWLTCGVAAARMPEYSGSSTF